MTLDSARRLVEQLPDEPRWLETRAMLRFPSARVSAGASLDRGFVVRLVHDALSAVSVVGCPPADKIVRATDDVTSMTPVLAQIDNAGHVQRCLGEGWRGEHAVLHRLATMVPLPAEAADRPADAVVDQVVAPPDIAVRLLVASDSLQHLPPGLRHEISHARLIAPVAGVFVNGVAASFCYPCWITESLWDVSIDTIEEYRGRALAQQASRFMMAHMRRDGREPVWGALESNSASLQLAAKLGFVPVDRLVVFSRGPWAYLTAGYQG